MAKRTDTDFTGNRFDKLNWNHLGLFIRVCLLKVAVNNKKYKHTKNIYI